MSEWIINDEKRASLQYTCQFLNLMNNILQKKIFLKLCTLWNPVFWLNDKAEYYLLYLTKNLLLKDSSTPQLISNENKSCLLENMDEFFFQKSSCLH